MRRLHVNVNAETAAALESLATVPRRKSITETVRQAIAVLKYLRDETDRGRMVIVMDRDGKNKQELRLM